MLTSCTVHHITFSDLEGTTIGTFNNNNNNNNQTTAPRPTLVLSLITLPKSILSFISLFYIIYLIVYVFRIIQTHERPTSWLPNQATCICPTFDLPNSPSLASF
jgi:hypothetical protein